MHDLDLSRDNERGNETWEEIKCDVSNVCSILQRASPICAKMLSLPITQRSHNASRILAQRLNLNHLPTRSVRPDAKSAGHVVSTRAT